MSCVGMDEDFSGKQYHHQPLQVEQMEPDPYMEFVKWYELAVNAGETEANAMCLTTVDAQQQPHARMVLMKGVDSTGLRFFTNYQSQKAQDLADNAAVAVVFWWSKLHRQVRITGTACKLSVAESAAYFASRPHSSQISAIASPQSQEISSRDWLLQQTQAIAEEYADKVIPCPEYWGGYRIQITTCEFWQGLEYRLHDRILYLQEQGLWEKHRLSP